MLQQSTENEKKTLNEEKKKKVNDVVKHSRTQQQIGASS